MIHYCPMLSMSKISSLGSTNVVIHIGLKTWQQFSVTNTTILFVLNDVINNTVDVT